VTSGAACPSGHATQLELADLADHAVERERTVLNGQQQVAGFRERATAGVDEDPAASYQLARQLSRRRRERADSVDVRPRGHIGAENHGRGARGAGDHDVGCRGGFG
jgi:hypothetical protein